MTGSDCDTGNQRENRASGEEQVGSPIVQYILLSVEITLSELVLAGALSHVVSGGWGLSPTIYVALILGPLAAPITLLTDALSFPLWVWYIAVLSSISNAWVFRKLIWSKVE